MTKENVSNDLVNKYKEYSYRYAQVRDLPEMAVYNISLSPSHEEIYYVESRDSTDLTIACVEIFTN